MSVARDEHMTNKMERTQHRRWLQVIIAALVVVSLSIIFKNGFQNRSIQSPQQGALLKMMGIKGETPSKLSSYQSVTGILDIQHWITKRGARVYFVPVSTLPMVDIQVVFDAGAARNGNKGGLAYLTNLLLNDGAKGMSADQIAENFENVGAQYHAESQRDMSIVHVRSLSSAKELSTSVQLLADVLSFPTFGEGGFNRERKSMQAMLKQQAQLPQQVASRAFFSAIYPNEPYSNWVLGDEQSLKAMTVQDVKAFHQEYYVAKNMVITIVGDLTAEAASILVEAITQNLPEGQPAPPLPPVKNLEDRIVQKIRFPSSQTHILIGEPVIKRGDPDFYALYVGNHVLGGNGSVSRIFNIIRSQHGLAYSAYSYFLPMREKGPFIMGCQTRTDQAEKALLLIETLLKDFLAKGPTEEELAQAKMNLIGGYTLQFDNNAAICRQVGSLGFYDLPLDHFNHFKSAVEALTVWDIKQTFEKRISLKDIAIVMVGGDPAEVTAPGAILEPKISPHDDIPSGPKI